LAVVLRRDDLPLGIEVLPRSPLPHDLPARGHLHQVVAVDAGGRLGAGETTSDPRAQGVGDGTETQQQDVPVAQPARVVMMVAMPDLPEHATRPVDLKRGASLESSPRLEPLEVLHHLARVEQAAVVEQVPVEAGTVRQTPRVHDLAVHVDEVDGTVSEHGRVKRVTLERAIGVVGDEPDTRAPDSLLVDVDHRLGRIIHSVLISL
jgi:hypothetical protein